MFSLSDFFTLSKSASDFDKKGGIDFTKYSKPKMCGTSELETLKYAIFHCFADCMQLKHFQGYIFLFVIPKNKVFDTFLMPRKNLRLFDGQRLF